MAANMTARKNVTRERKDAEQKKRNPFLKKDKSSKKKLSPEDKAMRKKKITNKEAGKIIQKETKARKIKREQKKAVIGNKPGGAHRKSTFAI